MGQLGNMQLTGRTQGGAPLTIHGHPAENRPGAGYRRALVETLFHKLLQERVGG